ncbi:MAG: TlyA family RNA methyltransferase [Clostridia bacterium]|nr:TlyA family RNA methyltransferase [Clostridia bacterium]
MDKQRLDVYMAEAGLAPSREKARAMIMAGEVFVNGQKADKAGQEVRPEDQVSLHEDPVPFVSRGGLKLDKALKVFPLTLQGKTCLDVGASTGGFTDCMLQNGARHVCALDVGYGQLDWKLRNDPRVTVMERMNARYMEPAWFPGPFDFASIDVSFISLQLILPPLRECLRPKGQVVALIKPQFEAGRGQVGKNGVVRDREVHTDVCIKIMSFAQTAGYKVLDLSYSPITGPKGNIEFLLFLEKQGDSAQDAPWDLRQKAAQIVDEGRQFHKNC